MAKAVYVQRGDNIDFTTENAVEYMDVVPLTTHIGVAGEPIAAGGTGTVWLKGVYDLPIAGGAAVATGAAIYWDAENDTATTTATDNIPAGMAVADKAAAATTVRVMIG